MHEKLANQRIDYTHKLSRALVNTYRLIVLEDINLKELSSKVKIGTGIKLGKSTMDNGFGRFRVMLKYKAAEAGVTVITLSKWFASSKLCNVCGAKNDGLTLSDRDWVCPSCGTKHNRDINAAINIVNEGLKTA